MSIFSGRHYTWLSNELRYIYRHTPQSQKPGVEMTIHQIAVALGRESRGFDTQFFLENTLGDKDTKGYKPPVTTERL